MFAFHIEKNIAFNRIEATFHESEKCGLKEMDFMNLAHPWSVIPKGSPYREIFKIKYSSVDILMHLLVFILFHTAVYSRFASMAFKDVWLGDSTVNVRCALARDRIMKVYDGTIAMLLFGFSLMAYCCH